jgi:hypothetical protein
MVFDALVKHAQSGRRSSALQPLNVVLVTLGLASLGTIWLKGPNWLSIAFASGAGIIVALYCFGFLYLLFKDRDALRSEKFVLSKMAIRKGLVGDSVSGLINSDDAPQLPALPLESDESGEGMAP